MGKELGDGYFRINTVKINVSDYFTSLLIFQGFYAVQWKRKKYLQLNTKYMCDASECLTKGDYVHTSEKTLGRNGHNYQGNLNFDNSLWWY